jgi:hypothetical protein
MLLTCELAVVGRVDVHASLCKVRNTDIANEGFLDETGDDSGLADAI